MAIRDGLGGRVGTRAGALDGVRVLPDSSEVAPSRSPRVLVERARAGDRPAFDALLERWLEPAFRMAVAILGDESDARDATQDAFLRAWRGLPGLHDPDRFDGWFTRILVNSCRALRRRRGAVREIDLAAVSAADEPATDFEASWAQRRASIDAVEHAFEHLSIDQRSILVLHHLEHWPLAQIAALLGIPEGTAKSRLFAARRALERALEDEHR